MVELTARGGEAKGIAQKKCYGHFAQYSEKKSNVT